MVQLIQVTKRFGDVLALDGVNLEIDAGEFLTLLGPSGCGKTTLLRLISGFERPDSGSICLAGIDVTAVPPYRRDVNQVFQSYALFPHLNVRENVAFGLRMKKRPAAEIAQRVARVMDMVNLGGMETRQPHQLSGGQRQRVALARALVCEPKVLLLDEPLAALDAKLRRGMQIELKRLQKRIGITFIFVTHDQDEAMVMSDRIAVVNDGKIEQVGTAADIYHAPATRFVADFLGQATLLPARVDRRNNGQVELTTGDLRFVFPTERLPGDGNDFLVVVRPEKVRLASTPRHVPGATTFHATVVEHLFRGPTSQLLLRTEAGLEIAAMLANSDAASTPPRCGERIVAQLHPLDLVLLNGDHRAP